MPDNRFRHDMPPYWGGHDFRPRPHGDTEYAHVVPPGESCCDKDTTECVCVTSADVEMWNKVSAISSISGIENLSALSAFESIITSADNWNETYETVDENSAYWNSAYDALSGVYSALNTLTDAVNEKNSIYVNTNDFVGNGSKTDPLGIKDADEFRREVQRLIALANAAFDGLDINSKNWVDKQQYADILKRIQHEYEVNIAQNEELDNQWKHIEEIIRRLGTFLKIDDYHPLKSGKGVTVDSNYKINVNDYDGIVTSANHGQEAYKFVTKTSAGLITSANHGEDVYQEYNRDKAELFISANHGEDVYQEYNRDKAELFASAQNGQEAYNYVTTHSADDVKFVATEISDDNIQALTAKNTIYYSVV